MREKPNKHSNPHPLLFGVILALLFLCIPSALLAAPLFPELSTASAIDDEDAEVEKQATRTRLPDPTYRLESIRFEGEFLTQESVVLDLLALEPGQPISVGLLKAARLRLLATGFFSRVQFGLEPGTKRGQAILRVFLEDRNTYLLSDLYLGSSKSSNFWGGLDFVDGNFLGLGQKTRFALVAGTDQQYGGEIGWLNPSIAGSGFSVGARLHYLSGREGIFSLDREQPQKSLLKHQRFGGILSTGISLGNFLGVFLDLRTDNVETQTIFSGAGGGDASPWVLPGSSRVNTARVALEYDDRDDPVMPRRGARVHISLEGSGAGILSDYSFVKLLTQFNLALEIAPGHLLRFAALGGGIFGDAPFFDRFFVGDLNDLIPSRDLGLNFSARANPDFFGTGANQLSYENFAVRFSGEYVLPLIDHWGSLDRVEFFVGAGVYGATTRSENRALNTIGIEPGGGERSDFPFDLTLNTGIRVETSIGIFGLSFANGLALIPF